MRFMVLVKATKTTEQGQLPTREMLTEMGKFNETLVKDGILLAADGLHPSSKGARICFDGGRTTVTDGPFTETKELVCGFWIVQGKSKEEIVERFAHAPMLDGDVLEVRRVFEAEDFGENLSPELAAREKELRERV
jgi:hypothetical protein